MTVTRYMKFNKEKYRIFGQKHKRWRDYQTLQRKRNNSLTVAYKLIGNLTSSFNPSPKRFLHCRSEFCYITLYLIII